MRINFLKEIISYSNILDADSNIHAWKSADSFPVNEIKDNEKKKFLDICAIEQVFEGIGTEKELFDLLFKNYNLFVKRFLFSSDLPIYFIYSEHKKETKNRVRSYKGILQNNFEREDYIQIETPIIDSYTVIAAIIKANKDNIDDCIERFDDSQRSCVIISTRTEIFSELCLKLIVSEMMIHKATSFINYAKLVPEFCSKGDVICRIGGDGGEQEVTFQIFCQKKKKELIIMQAEQAGER